MKTITNRKLFRCFTVCLLLMFSCGEKDLVIQEYTREPGDFAQVRFYNFSVNAPSVNFYVNGLKVTASQSLTGAMAPVGVSYGGAYPSLGYVEIPYGSHLNVTSRTPTTLTIPSNNVSRWERDRQVSLLEVGALENRKTYSLFMAGRFDPQSHSAESFILSDELPPQDTSRSFLRFVNSGVAAAGDLRVVLTYTDQQEESQVIILSEGLPFKAVTPFIAVPYRSYTISVTNSGGVVRTLSRSASLQSDRVNTFAVRGDMSTGTPTPFIDYTVNR